MDVTPLIPGGRQVIESYGPGGFRITGVAHAGAVLVFPERTLPWTADRFAAVDLAALQPVVAHGAIEILLLGCGARLEPLPPALRQALRAHGIGVDAMDTGAACRTYNVLLAEDRRVAAALIPPT